MKSKMWSLVVVACVAFGVVAANAHAGEISGSTGLLKTESYKENGTKTGSKRQIDLGTRYAEYFGDDFYYFGDVSITMRSFDAEPGYTAPSNSTSVQLGGGMRWHLKPLGESVIPMLIGQVYYLSDKNGDIAAGSVSETEKNGLYYAASMGLRLLLGNDLFADFESNLFESALFASSTTKTGGNTNETSRLDLSVSAKNDLALSVRIGFSF